MVSSLLHNWYVFYQDYHEMIHVLKLDPLQKDTLVIIGEVLQILKTNNKGFAILRKFSAGGSHNDLFMHMIHEAEEDIRYLVDVNVLLIIIFLFSKF